MTRRVMVAAAVLAGAVTVAGCGFSGVYDLPLPGGADLGPHPYQVDARFANVVDLVPQAAVKVNDVPVGRVTRIGLPANGWTADVTMLINGDVHLPANSFAYLQQSSLLGEKYVELSAPTDGSATGVLANGATIPISRTNRSPEVEEVLGALSLLLNGGGINQLHTITVQLNDALRGNEQAVRGFLAQADTLVANLNGQRRNITAALDGLDRLSATLAGRDRQIGNVLDNLSPGLAVLDQQRDQLVGLLDSLNTLSGVAVDTLDKSTQNFAADVRSLAPVLRQLANAGQALPQALQVLLTYPFTDQVLNDFRGDYLNVFLSVTAAPGTTIIPALDPDQSPATGSPGAATQSPALRQQATTDAPPLPLPAIDQTFGSTPTPGTTTSPPSSGPPGSTTQPPGSTSTAPTSSSTPPTSGQAPGTSTPPASPSPSSAGGGS
ncbi:MAG TPA: MCE family protein [Pseudonocardiaceae bacterium]|jgi:phospholipid/cholesterol/gamma-HCH transport system substrate-binding protein